MSASGSKSQHQECIRSQLQEADGDDNTRTWREAGGFEVSCSRDVVGAEVERSLLASRAYGASPRPERSAVEGRPGAAPPTWPAPRESRQDGAARPRQRVRILTDCLHSSPGAGRCCWKRKCWASPLGLELPRASAIHVAPSCSYHHGSVTRPLSSSNGRVSRITTANTTPGA